MIIYDKSETNFITNGYGFLTDIISAYVEEELNGDYSLTFEYATNGKNSEYIVEDNIVKCKVADGTEQLFTITNVVKTYDTLQITAKHIFYQLYFNMLEDVYPKNLNASAFLQWILSHTQYETNFTGSSDINASASARYVRKNPVEAILGADNCMINLFGGELKRDNFNIELKSSIGKDNGVRCQFAKNITGININIDTTETFTRIMPIGFDGLLLPEKYVDSPLINNYPYPKIGIFNFDNIKYDPEGEDEEAYHDIDEAYIALRNEVRKLYKDEVDKAQVSIDVDWLELSKVKEYEQYSHLEKVNLGDTIHVDILGMDFKTKVVRTKYNPLTDMIENFEIGTIKPNINSSINSLRNVVEEINPTSILEEAKTSATNLITQAMGGYIYKTNNELFIMDTDDPETAQKVWRWNINGLGYSSTGINGPYGLAMTMDGSIVADYITTGTLRTNIIEGYDSLVIQVIDNTKQYAILSQTLSELNSKIGDIADISTSAESDYALVELTNVNQSEPITIMVHPTVESISYLYPHSNIYPSSDLYLKTRKIRFHNYTTDEDFDYVLPDDLLIYDENTYDEFFLDYDTHNCRITKRCAYNADGTIRKLDDEVIVNYDYPTIRLTDGNYSVQLLGYEHGYLFTRLMAQNIYTTQFATKAELHSSISQTAEEINLEVRRKVNEDEIISRINQSAESIQINADKIDISGKAVNFKTNVTDVKGPFTRDDVTRIRKIYQGTIIPTDADFEKYDTDENGSITATDMIRIQNAVLVGDGYLYRNGSFEINPYSSAKTITLYDESYGRNAALLNLYGGTFASVTTNHLNVKDYNDSTQLEKDFSVGIGNAQISCLEPSNTRGFSLNTGRWDDEGTGSGLVWFDLFDQNLGNSINLSVGNNFAQALFSGKNQQTIIDSTGITTPKVTQTSLKKEKKNFEKLKNGLSIVKDTDIYKYNLKFEKNSDKKHIGFIIDDNFKYSKEITSQDNDGVDLYSMIAVAYKAIQEQQEQIEKLNKKIEVLENEKNSN